MIIDSTKAPNDAKPLLGVVVSNLSERVIDKPFYTEWDYPSEWGGGTDSIREKGKLNYEGLNEHEKTNFKLITVPAFLPNTCYVRLWVLKTKRNDITVLGLAKLGILKTKRSNYY
jgi:hypothetical protein